jgi:hypothetical protein
MARNVAHTDGASDSNVLAASGREQAEYLSSGPGSQGSSSPSRSMCVHVIPGLARDVICVRHGKHAAFYSSRPPRPAPPRPHTVPHGAFHQPNIVSLTLPVTRGTRPARQRHPKLPACHPFPTHSTRYAVTAALRTRTTGFAGGGHGRTTVVTTATAAGHSALTPSVRYGRGLRCIAMAACMSCVAGPGATGTRARQMSPVLSYRGACQVTSSSQHAPRCL